MTNYQALAGLGWGPFFQQQLSLEEWDSVIPARVMEQHKSIVSVATESETLSLPLTPKMPPLVVGDWVLLDNSHHFYRLLDRKTCFRRKAAGLEANWQLIAANVDTAFIVSSLNDDFNLSRIERYLALTNAATAEPVILLTKSDLVEDSEHWLEQVYKLYRALSVIAINALDPQCAERLNDWLGLGKTVVFLGSSGVGKSTLTNTLLGQNLQSTGGIREDDSKGRHTTTSRSLVSLPNGGMVLDTPGMRELQIADCQDGIASTFADIQNLAARCRFADCTHNSEPGCAVQKAVQAGEIDSRRLRNYQKLLKKEALNSSLAEKRAKDKALGKFYKRTLADAYKIKGRQ
jgi:ribosome biogenesis GTPase